MFSGRLGGGAAFTGANNPDLQGVSSINGVKPDINGNVPIAIDDIVLVDNDPTMAANSDEVIPTQKAVNERITPLETYIANGGNINFFVNVYNTAKT